MIGMKRIVVLRFVTLIRMREPGAAIAARMVGGTPMTADDVEKVMAAKR